MAPLAFYYRNRPQPRDLACDPCLGNSLYDHVYVLVRLGGFFGEAGQRAGPDLDSALLEVTPQLIAAHFLLRL